jgi:hypothetical protein
VNQEDVRKKLCEPFTCKEIEWKIQTTTQDKTRGMAVAYVDSRAIQKRLDETVGPFYWRNSYTPWQDKSQHCGLSIFDTERGEWVTKFDGAENTDYESVKGGLSDAFKRSAIVWGIGRYLYELGGVWVEIEQRGKSYAIKQDQYGKLEADYMKAIKRIFPERTRQSGAVTPSPSPTMPTESEPISEPANSYDFDYKVISAKPSGKTSALLELVDGNGELVSAYIKKSDSQSIGVGAHLRNVEMVRKEGSYGSYNLINAFEIAA